MAANEKPAEKLRGPASYFPSIEKTYGRPVTEWLAMLRGRPAGEKHNEAVNWLKSEFGMGHGHANALVHYARSEDHIKEKYGS